MPSTPVSQIVRNTSAEPIRAAFQLAKKRHFPNGRWIANGNRYRVDTTARIESDITTNLKAVEIRQYMAASVLLHCQDGWNFLSRAFECLNDGDIHSCAHLAYYAELRAVMSFFASEGIGVFDFHHIWCDASSVTDYSSRKGTHKFVKEALAAWALEPTRANRLLELLKVNSIPLIDWVRAAATGQGVPTFSQLAERWLTSWSMDITIIQGDQDIRNLASYRPQMLFNPHRPEFIRTLKSLVSFWEACEPTTNGRFGLLDMYLLRHALVQTYVGINGTEPTLNDLRPFVDQALVSLGLATDDYLARFLKKRILKVNHPIFVEAAKPGLSQRTIFHPVSMIARAILLLRLATAAANELVTDGSVAKAELRFWWHICGIETGLWRHDEGAK